LFFHFSLVLRKILRNSVNGQSRSVFCFVWSLLFAITSHYPIMVTSVCCKDFYLCWTITFDGDIFFSSVFTGDKAAQWWLQKTFKTHGSACNWGDIVFRIVFSLWICSVQGFFFSLVNAKFWLSMQLAIINDIIKDWYLGNIFCSIGSFWSRSTVCYALQIRKGKYLASPW
jgi:hypothetical protein